MDSGDASSTAAVGQSNGCRRLDPMLPPSLLAAAAAATPPLPSTEAAVAPVATAVDGGRRQFHRCCRRCGRPFSTNHWTLLLLLPPAAFRGGGRAIVTGRPLTIFVGPSQLPPVGLIMLPPMLPVTPGIYPLALGAVSVGHARPPPLRCTPLPHGF